MQKNYILDTNVLIHDPQSIFKFEDNNLYIPIYVLEELDKLKSEVTLRGRNSREACRILDELRCQGSLTEGVVVGVNGKLRIYVPKERKVIKVALDHNSMDNAILQCSIEIKESSGIPAILVTMDVNLRIRAECIGLQTASYESQSVDTSNMITGYTNMNVDIGDIDKLFSEGYLAPKDTDEELFDNICIMLKDQSGKTAIGKYNKKKNLVIPIRPPADVMGIRPRNIEQKFAMELLLDDNIKIVTLSGTAGGGKAQPLDSDILTPNGYIKMKDIKVGDYVSTPNGKSAPVVGIFPQGKKEVFEIEFSDGTLTKCCGDHLWMTKTSPERDNKKQGKVRSTLEIKESLLYRNYKKNHSIPITSPIEMPKRNLIIPPYTFGLLLGDGSFRSRLSFSTADDFLLDSLIKELPNMRVVQKAKFDYTISNINRITTGRSVISKVNGIIQKIYTTIKYAKIDGYKSIYRAVLNNHTDNGVNFEFGPPLKDKNYIVEYLKGVGLWNKKSEHKFIPNEYKYSSIDDRISILQGLMDTDGDIDKTGKGFHFNTSSCQLSKDVLWLIQSLGGTATVEKRITKYTHKGEKRFGQPSYRMQISMPNNINPFKLPRKANLVKPRIKYIPRRYICNVKSIGFEECQCILLDSENHLYITNDCIVTHNTLLALCVGLQKTLDGKYSRLLISRPIMPLGKDIGYLKGTLEEKMNPWMQPIYDNLELLMMQGGKRKGLKYDDMFEQDIIRVEPLTYIRGRSLPNQFILIDEAQNLTTHEIKTIITRCGEGSKIVLTGDPAQIDSPYMDKRSCGLSVAIEKLHDNSIVGHLTLSKGERSELANLAAELM